MRFKKTAAVLASAVLATTVSAKENNVGIFGTSGKTMGDHTFIAQEKSGKHPQGSSKRETTRGI